MMRAPLRLGLVAASPMYYQAPLYRLLAEARGIDFTAIFASSGGVKPRDAGFGAPVAWDVDILTGYNYVMLRKADSNPIGGGVLSLADWDVVQRVSEFKFDVLWVHGYNLLTNMFAIARQRAARRGLLFREEQTLLSPRPPWKQLLKRVGLPLLLGDARAVYIGTENRRWLKEFGFSDDRLFYSPYCVDNERLGRAAASAPRRVLLRERFGIPDDGRVVFLSVSRLVPSKQPLSVLDAFARVRGTSPCSLLVVGTGQLEHKMRERVERDRIPDVHFAGFLNQSQVAMAYLASDVFILFSDHEPWGLVVNEAMHFGLPVVASDRVGSAVDLVKERQTGYVVSHRDIDGLASRMLELLHEPALRSRLGEEGRRHVSDWNYDRAAIGIIEAARAAADSSSKARFPKGTGEVV